MYKISGEAGRAACFVHMKILPAIWLLAAGGSALAQQPSQNVPDAQRREGETLTEMRKKGLLLVRDQIDLQLVEDQQILAKQLNTE